MSLEQLHRGQVLICPERHDERRVALDERQPGDRPVALVLPSRADHVERGDEVLVLEGMGELVGEGRSSLSGRDRPCSETTYISSSGL